MMIRAEDMSGNGEPGSGKYPIKLLRGIYYDDDDSNILCDR